jgi:hypothetical protein
VRRHGRIDGNQPAIVEALRGAGASVQSLADLGHGVPDLLVGWRGINLLMEVKAGGKALSARRLTPDEQRWHLRWCGQVLVVEGPVAALAALSGVQCPREAAEKYQS